MLSSVKGGALLVEYETETRSEMKPQAKPGTESEDKPATKSETKPEAKPECRLKSMFLRAEELGWRNRVLAPHGFEFGYCEGPCEPIEFAPLPLVVRDGHRIKLKIYDDLLVSKCG